MLVNADFHVHSCFSMASSKDMLIENIAPYYRGKHQLFGGWNLFNTKYGFCHNHRN